MQYNALFVEVFKIQDHWSIVKVDTVDNEVRVASVT